MLHTDATQTQSVLVVDDEAALRSSIARVLSIAGYRVAEANDVASASASLEGCEYSAILTDLHMPGMSGVAMVEEVARRGHHTPVILMSSALGDLDPADGRVDRLAGILAKPFRVGTLRDLIGRVLQGPQ